MATILDLLLPIQNHSQQCAQKPLDIIPRRLLDGSFLNILGSEMRRGSREHVVETRAEHYNELDVATCQQIGQLGEACRADGYPGDAHELTAMFGLSARTYSCGGDGSRFGGGEGGASFLKYLVIPTGLSTSMAGGSSSEGGADDSEERSEPERDMALRQELYRRGSVDRCRRRVARGRN